MTCMELTQLSQLAKNTVRLLAVLVFDEIDIAAISNAFVVHQTPYSKVRKYFFLFWNTLKLGASMTMEAPNIRV